MRHTGGPEVASFSPYWARCGQESPWTAVSASTWLIDDRTSLWQVGIKRDYGWVNLVCRDLIMHFIILCLFSLAAGFCRREKWFPVSSKVRRNSSALACLVKSLNSNLPKLSGEDCAWTTDFANTPSKNTALRACVLCMKLHLRRTKQFQFLVRRHMKAEEKCECKQRVYTLAHGENMIIIIIIIRWNISQVCKSIKESQ